MKESFAGSFRANRSDGMNPGIRIERKNKPGIKSVHKVRYVKPIAPAGVKKHLQRLHIKKSPGGLFFYLAGMFFKVALRYSQNFSTEAMFTRSSGEWGEHKVGPKEIISQLGYFEPKRPHSKPA